MKNERIRYVCEGFRNVRAVNGGGVADLVRAVEIFAQRMFDKKYGRRNIRCGEHKMISEKCTPRGTFVFVVYHVPVSAFYKLIDDLPTDVEGVTVKLRRETY